MTTLYGSPISPFVRKVAVALEEKGIHYDWIPVRPNDTREEFKSISPLGKIPAFADSDVKLADSSVICFYLEKAYPEIPLYPADTLGMVKTLWFEEYFDGGMLNPMTTIFNEKWLNPLILGKPTDEALLAEAATVKLPPMLSYLESELRPQQWMVGNHFSIGDISLAVGFVNLRWAGYAIDKTLYPKLADYIQRIHDRPSFKKCDLFELAYINSLNKKSEALR